MYTFHEAKWSHATVIRKAYQELKDYFLSIIVSKLITKCKIAKEMLLKCYM